MLKLTFGTPEELVPSKFCDGFNYTESHVAFDTSKINFKLNARGSVITLPLDKNEQLYGLGLHFQTFNHTGKKITLRPNADPVKPTGDSHAPVPFIVSTAGYGIYVDTARYAEFYCGADPASSNATVTGGLRDNEKELYESRQKDSAVLAIQIPAAKGVDIYILEGKTITEICAAYNMLSGGGCHVPDWGFGLLYRCNLRYTSKQVMAMADYFRTKDIPCSILGLEPGWQTHAYSCTYKWDRTRYSELQEMLAYLKEKGYHLNLWEHAFTNPDSPIYDEVGKGCGDYKVWDGYVPDFALPEIRNVFADYHRDNVLFDYIDGFKLDECDSSDITGSWSFPNLSEFPSGLDGEQYHSLFGTLYIKAMLEALDGKETYSEVRNLGALAASYPFVLYSDLYNHKDFIRACVNSGFSGILWSPEVRHVSSKEELLRRLQVVVFSAQCLVNAWSCDEAPWLAFDCESEVRDLLKLREKLYPRLRKAFDLYEKEGVPPVRALVMDYTSDAETYNIDDEYLFCEDLLVAPISEGEKGRKVYLPEGEWVDFFTNEPHACGSFELENMPCEYIPVFRRVK